VLTLRDAIGILRRCNIGTGRFVQCVLEGEVLPCSTNPALGLDCFLYDKRDVYKLLRRRLKLFKGGSEDTFYLTRVADRMGLNSQGACFLAKKGIIRTRQSPYRPHAIVTSQTIDDFNSTYVSSAQLARELHIGPYYLSKLLMDNKIQPISGPKIDGGIQYLFLREDLERNNIAELIAANEPKSRQISRPENHCISLIELHTTAKILNLSRKNVLGLVESGVLRPHHTSVVGLGSQSKYIFNRFMVEKLSCEKADLTELVLVSVAAKMLGMIVSCFQRKWVNTGRLKPIQLTSIKARNFVFRKDLKAIAEEMSKQAQEKKNYMNTREAALALGAHHSTVLKWERSGKLKSISSYRANGMNCPLFLPDDVAQFRDQLVV
jgi:hypothetical protein